MPLTYQNSSLQDNRSYTPWLNSLPTPGDSDQGLRPDPPFHELEDFAIGMAPLIGALGIAVIYGAIYGLIFGFNLPQDKPTNEPRTVISSPLENK